MVSDGSTWSCKELRLASCKFIIGGDMTFLTSKSWLGWSVPIPNLPVESITILGLLVISFTPVSPIIPVK